METQKKCEVCGEMKPLSDFSKSYRNRCKACVAQQTKEKREQKKTTQTISFVDDDEEEKMWEQRRYEIARTVMPALWLDDGQDKRAGYAMGRRGYEYQTNESLAREAVKIADALIAELKKGGSE